MLRFLAILTLLAAIVSPSPVLAAPACGTHDRTFTDWGKTEPGFEATMQAGCHTLKWTGPTTDDGRAGTVTIRTVGNVDPWAAGYTLPGPQGDNYCQYPAAHEANGFATNYLSLPAGTEVTVRYRCE